MAALKNTLYVVGLAGCVMVFLVAGQGERHTDRGAERSIESYAQPTPQPAPGKPEFDVDQFCREEIEPLVRRAAEREQENLRSAIRLLDSEISDYGQGIKPLVEELTGWGTRFGITHRMVGDKWNAGVDSVSDWWHERPANPNRKYEEAAKFVNDKFQNHFVSEAKLRETLKRVTEQYASDIKASRDQLFGEIRKSVESTPLEVVLSNARFDDFLSRVEQRASRLTTDLGKESVGGGMVAMLTGFVAGEVVHRILDSILKGASTSLIASTVISSSVGAKVMLASGGAGSTAGPAGTIVGAGIGFVVGLLVDWYAEEKVKEMLTRKCHDFLGELRKGLKAGAESTFRELSESSLKLQKEALVAELKAVAERSQ